MSTTLNPLIVAEAPAPYPVDPPLVVDCSVLAALLFDEPERELATEHLGGRTLHAPWLLDVELASVASKKADAGELAAAEHGLADYQALAIQRHPVDPPALFDLGRRYRITVYDAAYLWLAESLGAPLATFDRQLGRAARRHLQGRGAA